MSLKEITILILDYADYFVIAVALFSFLTFRVSTFFKILMIYCLTISLLHLTTGLLAKFYIHNWFIYHILGAVEIIFSFLLFREQGIKKGWTFAMYAALALYIGNSVYITLRDSIILNEIPDAEAYYVNDLGLSLALFFILILGINFLWKLYKMEEIKDIGNYPIFYVSAGITVFAAGAFFVYLLTSNIMASSVSESIFFYSYILVACLTYIKFGLIAIGIWKARNGR
jgi:hypothetical protein